MQALDEGRWFVMGRDGDAEQLPEEHPSAPLALLSPNVHRRVRHGLGVAGVLEVRLERGLDQRPEPLNVPYRATRDNARRNEPGRDLRPIRVPGRRWPRSWRELQR
jgi:hypothetical protein